MPNQREALYNQFVRSYNALAECIYIDNTERGFWEEGQARNKPEMIALMHSELSEALECIRRNFNKPDEHIPAHKNVAVELADCIIRIIDFGTGFDLDIAEALVEKLEYNRTRPFKHGKLF